MIGKAAIALFILGVSVPAFGGVDYSADSVVVSDLGGGDFAFVQGGFSSGASVSGFFSGIDLNGDGQLSAFDDEVTDFSFSFSGNAFVSAFTLGSGNLLGLVYDLDGGVLGDGTGFDVEGIAASDRATTYAVGPGPFALCNGVQDCGVVVDTPEPPPFAVFGLGAAALFLGKRRLVGTRPR